MTLDQQLAATAARDIPAVFLTPEQRLAELRADILAAAGRAGTSPSEPAVDPYAFQTQPAILRRLADVLAGRLPATLDRLVAAGPVGVALTAAVALHTGLPYAVLLPGAPASSDSASPATASPATAFRTTLHGEIHRAEHVAVLDPVVTTGRRILDAAAAAEEYGARVAGLYAALGSGSGGGAAVAAAEDSGYTLQVLFPNSSGS
ncbi:hypothetical protein ADL22_00270 [Streptomyces sp. NRRL F-4489]|uniref:hypothetical protein n=1 Tax=Streptomyces sp. NRRL F-4489 TaxID=1609095 RepID=UPI000747ABB2|nr:hypothetical protein [Streptomyces sp. NRRL F-4489]KUL55371.1 hypothetical protein ADL22_00270 [Streptomyces sp. NRRL F-4489]